MLWIWFSYFVIPLSVFRGIQPPQDNPQLPEQQCYATFTRHFFPTHTQKKKSSLWLRKIRPIYHKLCQVGDTALGIWSSKLRFVYKLLFAGAWSQMEVCMKLQLGSFSLPWIFSWIFPSTKVRLMVHILDKGGVFMDKRLSVNSFVTARLTNNPKDKTKIFKLPMSRRARWNRFSLLKSWFADCHDHFTLA